MSSDISNEKLTGNYCFKKKFSGLVLFVEVKQNLESVEYTDCTTHFSERTIWRKAKEEDLINLM